MNDNFMYNFDTGLFWLSKNYDEYYIFSHKNICLVVGLTTCYNWNEVFQAMTCERDINHVITVISGSEKPFMKSYLNSCDFFKPYYSRFYSEFGELITVYIHNNIYNYPRDHVGEIVGCFKDCIFL